MGDQFKIFFRHDTYDVFVQYEKRFNENPTFCIDVQNNTRGPML